MIRMMRKASLFPMSRTLDSLHEQIITYGAAIPIEVSLSLSTGTSSSANNILTASSTHVGVTSYKTIAAGDKITVGSDTYIVDYPMLDGRYALLYLKKES